MDPVIARSVHVDVETAHEPEGHEIPSNPCPRSRMRLRVSVPADCICWVLVSRSRPTISVNWAWLRLDSWLTPSRRINFFAQGVATRDSGGSRTRRKDGICGRGPFVLSPTELSFASFTVG